MANESIQPAQPVNPTITINKLQLKAFLLSVITQCKFGQPLAPNTKWFKDQICTIYGVKPSVTKSGQMLTLLGDLYKLLNLELEFWRVIDKFDAEKYIQEIKLPKKVDTVINIEEH